MSKQIYTTEQCSVRVLECGGHYVYETSYDGEATWTVFGTAPIPTSAPVSRSSWRRSSWRRALRGAVGRVASTLDRLLS